LQNKLTKDIYDSSKLKQVPCKLKTELPKSVDDQKLLREIVHRIWEKIDDSRSIEDIVAITQYDKNVAKKVFDFLQKFDFIKIDTNEEDLNRMIAKMSIDLWPIINKKSIGEIIFQSKLSNENVSSALNYLKNKELIDIRGTGDLNDRFSSKIKSTSEIENEAVKKLDKISDTLDQAIGIEKKGPKEVSLLEISKMIKTAEEKIISEIDESDIEHELEDIISDEHKKAKGEETSKKTKGKKKKTSRKKPKSR